jgi:cytochrome c-type biogenesis protein CcmE
MRYRAFVIPVAGVALLLVGFLAFNLLNDNLVYFKTPSEVLGARPADGERLRLGGQVVPGTVVQHPGTVDFEVGDGQTVVLVHHQGAPAQLFREGIGIVVEGSWRDGAFHSDTMLIRHDEQYRTEDGRIYKPGEAPAES